ncbi:MAG: hypothetical protein ACLVKK_08645 [Ruthenibacterium sp.]
MKRFRYMLLCVLPFALLCTLCGCSSLSLGERAIVKAIYLDGTPGSYTVSLVVFTCEPTTDTASAKGEAKIYSATEEDIGEALEAAEKEQAKAPFYAQNELLFLGPQITQAGVGRALAYFTGEQAARPNLSVFAVPVDAQAFKKLEKTIAQTIQEAERVADDAQMGMGRTMSELALQNEEEQFSGLLPVLRFGEQEEPKVDSMLLFQNDMPQGAMHGTQLGLALVAGGQTDRMQFSFYHDGGYYHVETQRLRLVKQAAQEEGGLRLHLSLEGSTAVITRDGKPLHGQEAQAAAGLVNDFLCQEWEKLNRKTFLKGNDICELSFWLLQEDIPAAQAMLHAPVQERQGAVSFESRLRAK